MMVSYIFIGLLSTSVFVALCVYVILALCYRAESKDEQRITYREFVRISAVCPEKWHLENEYVVYTEMTNTLRDDSTRIYMKSYFDALRLNRLYKAEKKKSKNSILDRERAKLLKAWQQDINNYRDQYMDATKVYFGEGKVL